MARHRHLIVLAGLLSLYGYFVHFWPTFHTANESIRLYFVQSVVDAHTPHVDGVLERYHMGNVDRAEVDGHATLDKAPGLSYVVMPLYWVLTRLGMPTGFAQLPRLWHLLLLFGVALPCVLGVAAARRVVFAWTSDDRAAWTAALILGLCTPYAIYATLFFGHGPAAALAMLAFSALVTDRPLLCGALAGAMVLVDTPTLVLAAGLGVGAGLRRRDWRDLARFAAGAAPFGLAQLAHNQWLFGDPFTLAYGRKASGAFASIHSQGLYGFRLPTVEALLGLLAGAKRGLLVYSPVLLAAIPGLRLMWRKRRFDAALLMTLVMAYVLWIASFVDWTAGTSYGPRHLLPIVPLLALPVGVAVADPATWRWLRFVLPGLAVVSFASAWLPIATFPYASEHLVAPVYQLAYPLASEGHFSPNLGRALGVPEAWSAFPALLLALGIVALLKPSRTMVAVSLIGLVLFVGVAVGLRSQPLDREGLAARTMAECLMDHEPTGREVCAAAQGRWSERACACVK